MKTISAVALFTLVACGGTPQPRDAGVDSSMEPSQGPSRDGGDGGSTSDGGSCPPEAVVSCGCATGIGTSRCLADGAAWGACTCSSYGVEIFVAPNGSDTAAGTKAAPFATLERAQMAVRALSTPGPLPEGGVVVWLRGGVYPHTASFTLTSMDSGTQSAPVVYRGYPGETARLIGGKEVPASAFTTVTSSSPVWSRLDPTAQGQVVAATLSSLGISDYGTLVPRGFPNKNLTAALELFIDGARAPLGRWPDQDRDDTATPPDPNGSQVTLYGIGLQPDVSGTYVKDSVQDGVSSFTRQGQVGGKTYHLYRTTGGTAPSNWVAWFLTTNTSGYPAATDPFFFVYENSLQPMSAAQGGAGIVTFFPLTAVTQGYENLATVTAPTSFTFAENRTTRWTHATDAWIHGYFQFTWADQHLAVAGLDSSTGTITLGGTPYNSLNATLVAGGSAIAYAYNLLEEITEPGEWYLDRTSGMLYLWPPPNLASHDLVVSTLSTPLIVENGASHVYFQELDFEAARGALVQIEAGSDVQLIGCTLRDAGSRGVVVTGATNVTLDGDLIYATGEDAIALGGGDRPSLTKGNNIVQNSDIHDFGEWVWNYSPAVNLSGDGNSVLHNVLYDAPHSAILFDASSQHLIQYNDIHDVVRFASDAAAIYGWADWGSYGNLIQYNFIHSISTRLLGYGAHGIYLDNCLSGATVDSNLLVDIDSSAIFHNGGHDITMTNNVVVGAASALEATSYCTHAGAATCTAGGSDFSAELAALDYQQDPWASTYPGVATIPNVCTTLIATGSTWLTPYGTVFADNVSYQDRSDFVSDVAATFTSYKEMDHNLAGMDPLFVDAAAGNYNLQASSPALALPGFHAIPVDQIGIQR